MRTKALNLRRRTRRFAAIAAVEPPPTRERATTYFELLLMQPVDLQPKMAAVHVGARSRQVASVTSD